MAKHYSAELLRRLRNEIPIDWLIGYLRWPHLIRNTHSNTSCTGAICRNEDGPDDGPSPGTRESDCLMLHLRTFLRKRVDRDSVTSTGNFILVGPVGVLLN